MLDAFPAPVQPRPGIEPFTYRAPQAALDDLKRRLANTRWPEKETVDDWSQGVPLARVRDLVEYWRTDYDWWRAEAALNRFAQFRIVDRVEEARDSQEQAAEQFKDALERLAA